LLRRLAMAITSVRCPVLGAHVTQVTDLEGTITRIICAEYDPSTGACQKKKTALQGGPLTRLLERVAENTMSARDTLCVLRHP
jgi:hypothetical protein